MTSFLYDKVIMKTVAYFQKFKMESPNMQNFSFVAHSGNKLEVVKTLGLRLLSKQPVQVGVKRDLKDVRHCLVNSFFSIFV